MITSITNHVNGFPWLKFGHESYLFGEFRANANSIAKAAFLDLICYSAKQTPAFSLPANDKTLAGWVQITLNQWLKVKDLVLSQFTLGDDGRYHCNMLTDLYQDYDADKEQHSDEPSTPKEPKTRSTSAERMQRKRERDEALARQASQQLKSDADVTACDGVCDTQSVTSDGNVTLETSQVTPLSVTNGGKGEDSELNLNSDLDSNNSNTPPNNLAVISPPMSIDPVLATQSEPAQEPVKKPSRKRINIELLTEDDLVKNYGVLPRYAKDWLAFRAKKNAPLTPSSMELLISQAELAGITVAQAIEVCAKKPWIGFNATYNYKDVISVQKTANDATRLKGIAALVESGQSPASSESFIQSMTNIYGPDLVNESIISVITNRPIDVTEYMGTFLRSQARQKQPTKPIFGNVNSKFPIPTATQLTEAEIRESKEKLNDLPF